MSGFGGLVSASIIILIISSSLGFLVGVVITSMQAYEWKWSSIEGLAAPRPKPRIDNVLIYTSENLTLVKLNVTNVGEGSLRVRDFLKSDLILLYRDGLLKKAVRLNYSDLLSPNSWRLSRVFVSNREGDILNPIHVESASGLWDPGETLEIEVRIGDTISANVGLGVVLALPDGVVTTAEL
ncbi:MAG: hypothetical protein QW701_03025 [Candidatus Nezhaarchaeales archaeon]